jgi:hypothetical protein
VENTIEAPDIFIYNIIIREENGRGMERQSLRGMSDCKECSWRKVELKISHHVDKIPSFQRSSDPVKSPPAFQRSSKITTSVPAIQRTTHHQRSSVPAISSP